MVAIPEATDNNNATTQSTIRSVTVLAADTPPSFSGLNLSPTVTIPDKIYFTGTVNDDKGLSSIKMKVKNPNGVTVDAFTVGFGVVTFFGKVMT